MTKRIAIAELEGVLESVRDAMSYAYNHAEPVCCGRAGSECCGTPEPEWPDWAEEIMAKLHHAENVLRAIVAAHNPSGFVEVPDELVEGE